MRSTATIRIFLVFLVFCARTVGAETTIDLLRKQFVDYYTGAAADPNGRRVRDSLDALENCARWATAPDLLRTDGSWSDIDYQQIPNGGWSPWDHFRRLMVMARAYRTPGQSLYRDPRLLIQIEAALAYVPVFYGEDVETEGNWWFWAIGPALDLGPTLVLMRDEIRPDLLKELRDLLEKRIGLHPGYRPRLTRLEGQNAVWSALNHYSVALLDGSTERLEAVRDTLALIAAPQSGREGPQRDASFQQHGPQLYTGGYGSSFGFEMAKYQLLTRGTQYSLEQRGASGSALADYAADGIAWSLYHNYFDVSVIGREVAKPWANGFNGLATLLQMSAASSLRQTEVSAAARRMLDTWTETLPIELAALADDLEKKKTRGEWPSGHRHYWVSDYTVHRRPHYFASVKMLSKRTRSGERINGENSLGSRQSDGRFHLVLRGDEYAAAEAWPALDWTRLPGITVEQRPGAAGAKYGMGLRSFVGGTGDGRNGVSAMDFAAIESTLTARKGWVFFDDAIVFFVSSVKCLGGNRVETVVDQRPLRSGDSPMVTDRWIAAGGVGYFFPDGRAVEMRIEDRTGSWMALGGPSDWRESTATVLTMWIDHGAYPSNASAEYVIVPGVDGDAMRRWVEAEPITILENSETGSAARDNRTGAVGMIFWTPGTLNGISSDTPAVLFQTTTGSRIELSLADPAQGSGTYQVTLPGQLSLVSADPPVTLAHAGRSTVLTVPRNGGRTVRVTLRQSTRGRGIDR